ncbi:putative outer membrane starch-binding protein [Pontibacter ummariensis]|uniref:Starch-binding associating with outer membrane n=1 Tax=Pontibacter ummariensis TaxID=1610492 RepID=A0A239KY26_9BACT|nr:RagB/SusD family nutrient uptake outer membrane protein [Pontibacter ummariensis]PRY04655.1 putative outer membrane starch-binding protein [Pontibacter ummariensis]SNT23266.1 Starch-binding associating with outer membrane [Pontibacter ummariensis]
MKSKYLKYVAAVALGLPVLSACEKEFLEVDPKGVVLESNYYNNPDEAFAGIVAAYDPLGWEAGGTYHNIGAINAASDDAYAGGGGSADMNTWQVWNNYSLDPALGPQGEFWNRNFTGVSRANTILEKVQAGVPGLDETTQARFIAEAKFLRAYYYFDLVRLFKNVPLFTAPVSTQEIYNVTQASPEEVYAQIEKDLTEAIPNLPVTVPLTEGGRASQGTGRALLGKVYLYQQKWSEAATQLAEVNGTPGGKSKYGYELLDNFGDIFRPDNKFNSESILEIVHTSVANSGWGNWPGFEGNVAVTMFGPRGYSGDTYMAGWGFNPLTQDLVDNLKGDPRYKYTVANIDSLAQAGAASYEKGYHNTGYFVEKYAPKVEWKTTGGGEPLLNWPNDYIEIRLADTYLMEAEAIVQGGGDASRAAALLNAVRARVGLAPVAATLENIYKERRLELATEGHRWYDLVRTGRAATVLASKGFKAGKHEILPIPQAELNNTKLVQNPGY